MAVGEDQNKCGFIAGTNSVFGNIKQGDGNPGHLCRLQQGHSVHRQIGPQECEPVGETITQGVTVFEPHMRCTMARAGRRDIFMGIIRHAVRPVIAYQA